MKEYLKSQIKNLPFIVIVFVLLYGITTFATSYLFDSSRVKFDATGTDIQAGDVQSAIGELYCAATDYTGIDTRVTTIENNFLSKTYPIGSIYISVTNTNPETLFGGTWVAFGSGKTLVGVDTSDTNYDTVEESHGAKTVTLTTSNLPAHNHSIPTLSGSTTAANNVGSTTENGGHSHSVTKENQTGTSNSNGGYGIHTSYTSGWTQASTSTNGAHTHKLNIPSLTVSTSSSNTNGCTNCNGTAFSTIDPYITVYMWKRTA